MKHPTLEYIRHLPAEQQPVYDDPAAADMTEAHLTELPGIVLESEIDQLNSDLRKVEAGKAFLLQGGDCAEKLLSDPRAHTERQLRVILAMTATFMYGAGMPVVKVPRIGGQLAKPRSSPTETKDGVTLPSFRGSIVNDPEFTAEARRADPARLILAHTMATKVAQHIHELSKGDFTDLSRAHEWNEAFAKSAAGEHYSTQAELIRQAITFMKAIGVDVKPAQHADIFTSHEELLLVYALGLTRTGSDGQLYDSSAHMLWIGDRTRQLDGAHVAYAAATKNPWQVKVGPSASPDEVVALCKAINPANIPGRLTLIGRFGVNNVGAQLPPIIDAVQAAGQRVIWSSDPMHGNTVNGPNGRKTRHFDDIVGEVSKFFNACEEAGTHMGGLHIEMNGSDITECIGGNSATGVTNLEENYDTMCDPRLSYSQSLELAFLVADMFKNNQGK